MIAGNLFHENKLMIKCLKSFSWKQTERVREIENGEEQGERIGEERRRERKNSDAFDDGGGEVIVGDGVSFLLRENTGWIMGNIKKRFG